jgi:hypothetical protein
LGVPCGGVGEFAGLTCPDTQSVRRVGDIITIRKGCGVHASRTPNSPEPYWNYPHFQIADSRFSGPAGNYLTILWDDHNRYLINVSPKDWPDGVESVEVMLVEQPSG